MTDRFLASLVYDTEAQPLSSGIRAVIMRARRLLYAAGETELVLQVAPGKRSEQFTLTGQVLDDGMPAEGAAVTLQGPAGDRHEATDEEGEFMISPLSPGSYGLEVERPTRCVSVDALMVE